MFRQLKYLAFLLVISLFPIAGLTIGSAQADSGDPASRSVVCYFVDIGYQNTSSIRQTVDAYVVVYPSGERVTQTYTFSLDGGQSGGFHMVFQIANPAVVFQYLGGTWFQNPDMIITSYDEDYLPIEDCTGHLFNDGRINDGENEKAAPAVAYCETDGLGVYDIDDQSRGNLVFRVSYADLTAGLKKAVAEGVAQVLGQGGDDTLYALPSNELQLSGPEQFTGKQYDHIFAGDICGTHNS